MIKKSKHPPDPQNRIAAILDAIGVRAIGEALAKGVVWLITEETVTPAGRINLLGGIATFLCVIAIAMISLFSQPTPSTLLITLIEVLIIPTYFLICIRFVVWEEKRTLGESKSRNRRPRLPKE